METLYKHIQISKEDWQFEILSINTTKSIDDIKNGLSEI